MRLILAALILSLIGPTAASAIPPGFSRPPSKLFLTCPLEPENFDRRALSQRSA